MAGKWAAAGEMLAHQAARLEAVRSRGHHSGHQHHPPKLADYITKAVSVPLLHIAEATAGGHSGQPVAPAPAARPQGFTMEQDFYTGPAGGKTG